MKETTFSGRKNIEWTNMVYLLSYRYPIDLIFNKFVLRVKLYIVNSSNPIFIIHFIYEPIMFWTKWGTLLFLGRQHGCWSHLDCLCSAMKVSNFTSVEQISTVQPRCPSPKEPVIFVRKDKNQTLIKWVY